MTEQHSGGYYNTPFKFSGKELDEETGLHYFGARYYDSRSSIWMSVDPLAESFPNWNPYNYTMQNPINLVDPTGMAPEDVEGEPKKKLKEPENKSKECKKPEALYIKPIEIQKYQGGYPGEGLDMLVTSGIQWLGEQISGSDVSKETSENIQLVTSLAVVITSKGKNANADAELTEQVSKKLGIETANGIKITGFGKHALNRVIGDFSRKGVKSKAILDALKNPLVIKDAITDGLGRQSQRFIGRAGEVVVNPSTGKIISVNPASSRKVTKLLEQIKK